MMGEKYLLNGWRKQCWKERLEQFELWMVSYRIEVD